MGIDIGRDSNGKPVSLDDDNYSIHVLGTPGVGKSHLLASIAEQSHANGDGVLLLDIKDGDLPRQVAGRTARPQDVMMVAPGLVGEGRTWSINLMEGNHTLVVDQTMEMFDRNDVFSEAMTQVKQHLSMGILLALQDDSPTIKTVLDILVNPRERNRILAIATDRANRRSPTDPVPAPDSDVLYFWHDFNAQGKRDDANNRDQRSQIESTAVRLREMLIGDPLGALLKSPNNSFLLDEWLDSGKMVVCDLVSSYRGMPMRQSRQMANIIIALFVNKAIARRIDSNSRTWRLIADEFDLLASASFVHSIDKLRSKRVVSVMAHQNFSQIKDKQLAASLASQQAKLYFRISHSDFSTLRWRFGSDEANSIVSLKNRHVRLIQPPMEDSNATEDILWFLKKPDDKALPQGKTLRTEDWWQPFSQEQYDEVLERSNAYTVPRHDTIEVHDARLTTDTETTQREEAGKGTPQRGPESPSATTGRNQPVRDNPPGARSVPDSQQHAGVESTLSEDDERSQEDIHRGGSQGRSRPFPPTSLRGRLDRTLDGVSGQSYSGNDGDGESPSEHPDQARIISGSTPAGGGTGPSLPNPLDP